VKPKKQNKVSEIYIQNKYVPYVHAYAYTYLLQGGSNMTGTDLCVNKPHCAAAVRP